jgi:hypothetical protein
MAELACLVAPDSSQRHFRGREMKASIMMHIKRRNRQLAVDYYLVFYYYLTLASRLRHDMATAMHS